MSALTAKQIFEAGICTGCCDDMEVCMCSFCCPYCAYGQAQEKAGLNTCFSACCMYCCLDAMGCGACVGQGGRGMLQVKAGIENAGCMTNWCCHCCCRCCAIAQEGRAAKALAGEGKPTQPAAAR